MVPQRITSQTFFHRRSWSDAMEKIRENWDKGFVITDFDYGGGVYAIVMSKGTGWRAQAVRTGSSFPKDEIRELWEKDYSITSITHDGDDWIVVMSKVEECHGQSYFTRDEWSDFKDGIREAWDDDKIMTTISCKNTGTTVYCGVSSRYRRSKSQSMRFISGRPTPSELLDLLEDGKIVTDFHDVDGGVLVISESGFNYSSQYAAVGDLDNIDDKIGDAYDKDYSITAMAYYEGKWLLMMSK